MAKDDGARIGTRESNKQDKLARIMVAAREAFSTRGYSETTLRQVADAAGIASGTVFLYAATKEALLCMVFKQEIQPVIDLSFRTLQDGPLLDQLLHILVPIADHHADNLNLGSHFLKEFTFVGEPMRTEMADFMRDWMDRIGEVIERAKARGEIREDINVARLTGCVMRQFLGLLRIWVAGRISREEFDTELEAGLELLLMGLEPNASRRPVATQSWRRRRAARRG